MPSVPVSRSRYMALCKSVTRPRERSPTNHWSTRVKVRGLLSIAAAAFLIPACTVGAQVPSTALVVGHRSDASGTTFIWTSYLTEVSPAWAKQVGAGKDVKWPVGLGGAQNAGVAGQVKQIPGAVGYVELAYARQNKLGYATVQNAAGKFVAPTIKGVTAAAEGVAKGLPATTDFRVSIINAPGNDSYPISSMTWAL